MGCRGGDTEKVIRSFTKSRPPTPHPQHKDKKGGIGGGGAVEGEEWEIWIFL